MKILLNAYNLKFAGGLNVAFNFIQQLKNYPGDEFYVLAPGHCNYESLETDNVKIILVPDIFQRHIFRMFIDHIWIKGVIRKLKPDVIFSMGNYALPTKVKQGLLFHFSYLIYPWDKKYKLPLKDNITLLFQYVIFKSRLKYVDRIFPQTKVAGERLRKYYGNHLKIYPVYNAYTKLNEEKRSEGQSLLNLPSVYKHLVCLTKYYTHKNIEILLEVGRLLKRHGSNIRIITTVEAGQHKKAKIFLENIKKNHLEDYIINIGPVSIYDVPQLYRETDGLILPTYLESFSATYVDAMYFRRPIFTSNMDFALEVCGDAAYYFDPSDSMDIFKVISRSFNHPGEMETKIEAGVLRIASFPDWEKVVEIYIMELKRL